MSIGCLRKDCKYYREYPVGPRCTLDFVWIDQEGKCTNYEPRTISNEPRIPSIGCQRSDCIYWLSGMCLFDYAVFNEEGRCVNYTKERRDELTRQIKENE